MDLDVYARSGQVTRQAQTRRCTVATSDGDDEGCMVSSAGVTNMRTNRVEE